MVLDFDIPIETLQETFYFLPSQKIKKQMLDTHPSVDNRIKHAESLRTEVELEKAHGKQRTVFDWQTLANEVKSLPPENK